jgi:general secretion pathway protein G
MRRQKGFTLIELLIVVAIIGIIAAIAIPNLLNAINRGRQKRTMADIRSLATAIESYAVDWNFYPTATAVSELEPYLTPTYIRKLPARDGWNNAMVVDATSTAYTLQSYGKDNSGSYSGGVTTDFNEDIWYANGSFVQWPEGMQIN